ESSGSCGHASRGGATRVPAALARSGPPPPGRRGSRPPWGRRRTSGRAGGRGHGRDSCRTSSNGTGSGVGLEGGAHGAVGVVKTGAGCAGGNTEGLGD